MKRVRANLPILLALMLVIGAGTARAVEDDDANGHWAFQPVGNPSAPSPSCGSEWIRNPIDAFIQERLSASGLEPSPEADHRTLIRRLSYTIKGLPPSFDEVQAFLNDESPLAYERLVDRLLDSPQYGEHWGRLWLDIARYADTKGYVYAREERFWTHAWAYRDWVVQALNEDLPYDRFLQLQIAADQTECRAEDQAAMGFLTLGQRFLGVTRDIIDDRIDVVCRGTMALTVGCARCHDHKYDPIPTADYYSLYGVFDSSEEDQVALDAGSQAFQVELTKRRQALAEKLKSSREESSERARQRLRDYLHAQTELHKYPAEGFDQIFGKDDLLPAFVRRWETYLHQAKRSHDPVFVAWHAFQDLPQDHFAVMAPAVTSALANLPHDHFNPKVAQAFATAPANFEEVIDRYANLFHEIDALWKERLKAASESKQAAPSQLGDPAAEQLRKVLYADSSPCQIPNQPIVHVENFFDSSTCTAIWKLQGEVDRWIVRSQEDVPFSVRLVDRPQPKDPRIFIRGNSIQQGRDVPRQFLSVLLGKEQKPFQHGSGRLELAKAIIAPDNPLTARVIVNRVWA